MSPLTSLNLQPIGSAVNKIILFVSFAAVVFVATFADWPPIATDFLGANPAAAVNEIVEILAGQLDWFVGLFALVQILLERLFAGHPANLALVCVQLLRLSLYGFFHTPIMTKN